MRVNKKKSAYSMMYLVTPSIYEKLKKCIDEYDAAELSKLNDVEDDSDHSKSDEIIRNISQNEISGDHSSNVSNTQDLTQPVDPGLNVSQAAPINPPTFIPPPTRNPSYESVSEENFTPQFNSTQKIHDDVDQNTHKNYNTSSPKKKPVNSPYHIPKRSNRSLNETNNSSEVSWITDLKRNYLGPNYFDNLPTINEEMEISGVLNPSINETFQPMPGPNETFQPMPGPNETFQPMPGPSRNRNNLFAKKTYVNKDPPRNFPVNIPQTENGNYIIHPNDADITWIEQNIPGSNETIYNATTEPSEMDITGDTTRYSAPNISQINQSYVGNDGVSNLNSTLPRRPGYVVKRLTQPSMKPKTRAQKRNTCDSILPLKGCKPKVKVSFTRDQNIPQIEDIKIKQFQCHLCQRIFKYSFNLKRHLEKLHNTTLNQSTQANTPKNESWVKLGKRSDTQAGLQPRAENKFIQVGSDGSRMRGKPKRTFKNWKV